MTRLSVSIDPNLLTQAQQLTGAPSKREVIDQALRELVSRKRQEELAGLAGSGLVAMDLEELRAWRDADRL